MADRVSEVLETRAIERDLADMISNALDTCCTPEQRRGMSIHVSEFEGYVGVPAGTDIELGFRICRALRGGRDFSLGVPADHHLNVTRASAIIGETMDTWRVASAFRAPEGYFEP